MAHRRPAVCFVLLLVAAGSALSWPTVFADSNVGEVDHLINATCQSFGAEFVDLIEQIPFTSVGTFNEDFLFDCSQATCGVIGGGAFDCEANTSFVSTVSPYFFQAQADVEVIRPPAADPCYSSCNSHGVAIYEAVFTTDRPYRMVFTGSTLGSEVTFERLLPFTGWFAHHYDYEDGPLAFDGEVEAGTFRVAGTTNPGEGTYDFVLMLSDPGAAGPPPVPDGASVAGAPLTASRNGHDVDLVWTPTACAGGEVNVYAGAIGDFGQFTSGYCGLPSSGSATVGVPDNSWFLVVNTDGGGVDGSWSRDADGNELTYGGLSVCPATTSHQPDGTCP